MRSEQVHNRMQGKALHIAIVLVLCVALYISAFWLKLPRNIPAGETPSVELLPESQVSVRVHGDHKSTLHFQIGSNQYFKILVQEPVNEIVARIVEFRRRVLSGVGAWNVSGAGPATSSPDESER